MTETQKNKAHIIVFGNEKGGSGKSTTAMHVTISLLRLGYKVGSIDLDARQGTFTRYIKNRWRHIERAKINLPCPFHMDIPQSRLETLSENHSEELSFITLAIDELAAKCDFIIIDTPGSDTNLSRLGHSYADTLVTPLNDSLIDLDVLAHIDEQTASIESPSVYTKMVEEQNICKVERGANPIHWIVMRNRLSHIDAQNKHIISELLEAMSKKFGFQLLAGFGERVIFRELFLKGMTLLDVQEEEIRMTLSQLAARQEVRKLVEAILSTAQIQQRGREAPLKSSA